VPGLRQVGSLQFTSRGSARLKIACLQLQIRRAIYTRKNRYAKFISTYTHHTHLYVFRIRAALLMGTPATLCVELCRTIGFIAVFTWGVALIVSSFHTFHVIYSTEKQKLLDDAWLKDKCSEPEFYINLRQHTDLCAQVQESQRENTFLKALDITVSQTNLCGPKTCLDLLQQALSSKLFIYICIVLCIVTYSIMHILHVMSQRQRHVQNTHYAGMPAGCWVPNTITELEYLNNMPQQYALTEAETLNTDAVLRSSGDLRNRKAHSLYNAPYMRIM
jgi:hypothetical protein